MSTYTGSELATKYAAYLIYKGTATPTEINQISSPKIGYVFDVTDSGTLVNGNITVVEGDAVVFLARGWTHMNNGSADEQIETLAGIVSDIQEQIGDTDFSEFALKTELPDIPTDISTFNNDAGYLTQHQSLADYSTTEEADAAYVQKISNMEATPADGTIVQYIGTTTANYTQGFFYIYHTGQGWQNIRVSEGGNNGIKQANTLDTGTEGEIVFYTGTTTEDYITNNFYKYTAGEWQWVDVPGTVFVYNQQTKQISLTYGKSTNQIDLNAAIIDNTDTALDAESHNPVQNRVINEAISNINTSLQNLEGNLEGLKIEFDAANMQMLLIDKDDNLISSTNLASLAKDAMLEDVELYTEAETGVTVTPPYLKFTFNTDAGQQPIRVELSDFVVNINIDAELLPTSTNAVENRVIKQAIDEVNERIDNLTMTPDAELSMTSLRPVQNRTVTAAIRAIDSTGSVKQTDDLTTYEALDGDIVEYIGQSTQTARRGFFYERIIKDEPCITVIRADFAPLGIYTYIQDIEAKSALLLTLINEDGKEYYCGTDSYRAGDLVWYTGLQGRGITSIKEITNDATFNIILENGDAVQWQSQNSRTESAKELNDGHGNTIYYSATSGQIYTEIRNNKLVTAPYFSYENATSSATTDIWRQVDTQPRSGDEDKADNVPTFEEATTRTNLAGGGEDTPTLWGKVKKWFADLRGLAFVDKDGDNSTKFLRGDGTWQTIDTTDSTKVLKTGDTISGTLILSRTQDASGTANNKPALIVGGTDSQAHIEIDANEIIAKASGTTGTKLWLQDGNGDIGLKGTDYSVANPDKFRTAIGAGTSDLELGTTATTAAKGNHTHTLTIATDSGTNQLTLAHATKYKLTAGGKTFIFTMPGSGAPSVTTATGTLGGSGYALAKFGNVCTLRLASGISGTYTLPSNMPKPNSTLSSVTNGQHIKITQTQIIVTSGYADGESITYICQ